MVLCVIHSAKGNFRCKSQAQAISAVQRPNDLKSTQESDEEFSPSLGRFESAWILGLGNVLIYSWQQSESDCGVEGRQVIKHNLIE